jgi:hypothetical protein
VERLSRKPVELGPALQREQGSWQAGGCGCLTPGWWLSQQGRAPVIPHGAGARQVLMGRWVLAIPGMAGAQQGLKGSGLVGEEQLSW